MRPEEFEQNKQLIELKKLKKKYQNVFGSDEGKEVLADIASKCFMDKPVAFAPQGMGIDPLAMAFRDGKRFTVLEINTMLKRDDKDE